MAYDEGLAVRIEEMLQHVLNVEEKKMFGGLAFVVSHHMCVGVIGNMLMARVGPQQYAECLKREFAKEMTFTGKPMKGMVYVEPEGISSDDELKFWIDSCLDFIATLPAKE